MTFIVNAKGENGYLPEAGYPQQLLISSLNGSISAPGVPPSRYLKAAINMVLLFRRGGYDMRQYKIIVEKHPDGYVAYPLGLKGVVVGQGDTYEEALADVKSAIRFHIETFGEEVLEVEPPILEAFVAEARV
ncbi:MAG: type II toxin-antitoxin system HicB family antitoxin [Thermodesulfovibrionales bacterium]|nr:type II toxin-antitoxin system HicB family antitoxin [Thermodesulfovibrionales bacterium]